jgi:hypothetical protein
VDLRKLALEHAKTFSISTRNYCATEIMAQLTMLAGSASGALALSSSDSNLAYSPRAIRNAHLGRMRAETGNRT